MNHERILGSDILVLAYSEFSYNDLASSSGDIHCALYDLSNGDYRELFKNYPFDIDMVTPFSDDIDEAKFLFLLSAGGINIQYLRLQEELEMSPEDVELVRRFSLDFRSKILV